MDYKLLEKQLKSLFENETDMIANMANMSAFVFQEMKDINWAGFYIARENQLVLGPFQGKVACVRIPWGKGVCGSAAEKQETILVENVHEFPGHIACDSASNSELVIPVIINNKTFAIFDIDSPSLGRFTEEDKKGVETLVKVFENRTKLN
ncbi:MAG: GAF domain-containing protein [Calditrichaeota bacterium]|nr:MAG: GAF domain-containing protein [Calditrichota bacterium]MBL1204105.1 GAF domain-containing protein [Calditrichota bacterium]NOG43936.1 GAF domain-containing protein [Calditrichota bacterium]